MVKVCHITSAHPKEDGRIFNKECISLAKAGFDVYLVQEGESYEKNEVKIRGFGRKSKNRIKRMTIDANNAIKIALELDADLYHLHDPELLLFAKKLKKAGKTVVFDSHEVYSDQILYKAYLRRPLNTLIANVYKKYETAVCDSIDAVIVSSTRDGKMPILTHNRNVIAIDNLPDLSLYNSYDSKIKKIPRSICCFGTIAHTRGITALVRAAHKAKAEVFLAGNIHSEAYKNMLENMPEFSSVHYLGLLSQDSVVDYLKQMEIGYAVLLNVGQYNKDDNLPTKAYECMSLGIPVLLSKCKYNEKLIDECCFGICVDPDNNDEIVQAITYLLDHPEEARMMGENGRKLVNERFNWDNEQEKLIQLYKKIL